MPRWRYEKLRAAACSPRFQVDGALDAPPTERWSLKLRAPRSFVFEHRRCLYQAGGDRAESLLFAPRSDR